MLSSSALMFRDISQSLRLTAGSGLSSEPHGTQSYQPLITGSGFVNPNQVCVKQWSNDCRYTACDWVQTLTVICIKLQMVPSSESYVTQSHLQMSTGSGSGNNHQVCTVHCDGSSNPLNLFLTNLMNLNLNLMNLNFKLIDDNYSVLWTTVLPRSPI